MKKVSILIATSFLLSLNHAAWAMEENTNSRTICTQLEAKEKYKGHFHDGTKSLFGSGKDTLKKLGKKFFNQEYGPGSDDETEFRWEPVAITVDNADDAQKLKKIHDERGWNFNNEARANLQKYLPAQEIKVVTQEIVQETSTEKNTNLVQAFSELDKKNENSIEIESLLAPVLATMKIRQNEGLQAHKNLQKFLPTQEIVEEISTEKNANLVRAFSMPDEENESSTKAESLAVAITTMNIQQGNLPTVEEVRKEIKKSTSIWNSLKTEVIIESLSQAPQAVIAQPAILIQTNNQPKKNRKKNFIKDFPAKRQARKLQRVEEEN